MFDARCVWHRLADEDDDDEDDDDDNNTNETFRVWIFIELIFRYRFVDAETKINTRMCSGRWEIKETNRLARWILLKKFQIDLDVGMSLSIALPRFGFRRKKKKNEKKKTEWLNIWTSFGHRIGLESLRMAETRRCRWRDDGFLEGHHRHYSTNASQIRSWPPRLRVNENPFSN